MQYIDCSPAKRSSLLNSLTGSMIVTIARCSLKSFDSFQKQKGHALTKSEFFKHTCGPIVLVLEDGREIAFFSVTAISSIVIWEEKNLRGEKRMDYLMDDDDLETIRSTDNDFDNDRLSVLHGKSITSVSLLESNALRSDHMAIQSEEQIEIQFEDGNIVVLGRGLIAPSDNFTVAFKDEMASLNLDELKETEPIKAILEKQVS